MAAEFHIHLEGTVTSLETIDVLSEFSTGQSLFNRGYMNAIPAIAVYDSWKPTERIDEGEMHSWSVRAVINMCSVLRDLPDSLALSFRIIKRKALTKDGPAPVASV